MGLTTADVDGNGLPDYFGTSIGRSVLMLGQPDGTFEDGTEAWGVESALSDRDWRATWGCAFLDAENDGSLDLYVASGYLPSAVEIRAGLAEPNIFYSGLADDPPAADVATAQGIDARDENHGVAIGDVDGDGDEDILTSSTGGDVHLYENDAAAAGLTVRLHGTVSNPDALGALVSLGCAGVAREREITVGGSFGSGHAALATLPLAGCEAGGEVGIRWPSGLEEVVPIDGTPGLLERTEPEWFVASPEWIPADGTATSQIAVTLDGPGHVVSLEATAASIGPVSDLGDGTYEATLSAPDAPGESALTLTVDGEPSLAHPRVRFFPAGGDRTTLHASVPAFVADDTLVRLTAVPRDASGAPDGFGHSVTFDLDGASPIGVVQDQGDGRYGLSVRGDGGAPIGATVRVDGIPRGPALSVPEIVAVDPAETRVRLIPGWVPTSVWDEDLAKDGRHTYVTVLVSPRDGGGDIHDDGLAFDYEIVGDAGPVAFERIPRGGGVSLRMFAKVLLEAGDATLTIDGVPIAHRIRLDTYDSDDELRAAVDVSKSRIGPYLESAYADGQDYAWIEAQLRDTDGDSVPMSESFSFGSDEMALVEEFRYGGGEEGKARMRATGAPGRAWIDVTYAGAPIGVGTFVDLLPARPRDFETDRLRLCVDDTAREATGLANIHVEVVALDDLGQRKGSGYPLRLWLDRAETPLDYRAPGGFLADFPVPSTPELGEVAASLDGTDRGAKLTVEFLEDGATPTDPDRPYCAFFEHGFTPPVPPTPGEDAGPDAGDAGPLDAGTDASILPPDLHPQGGGCACRTTSAPDAVFSLAVLLAAAPRRRALLGSYAPTKT
jgi:MYXO-CTERM domain-containing protein